MNNIKKIIRRNKKIKRLIWPFYKFITDINVYIKTKKEIISKCKKGKRNIFYLGVPAHTNLGDLAQYICIKDWIQKYYNNYTVVEIETNALVNTRFSAIKILKKYYDNSSFFIFQSGYTTTDLGGYADEMHKFVINNFNDAKMLMMPQTIFFKSDERRQETSRIYNSARNMLYLARDKISYSEANKMFPDIEVLLYPDIVTSLIGKFDYTGNRDGILFCCRNDDEKYYSDEEIDKILNKLANKYRIDRIDTTKKNDENFILKKPYEYIMKEIECYSRYKLIITDRYHGTIFSLIANTPVIVMKTNDHKVTTGVQWFEGVYDDYIYLSKSLDDVYDNVDNMINKHKKKIIPYFEKKYYSKLSKQFDKYIKR